ncbi:MAG TPA: hypothetical protein VKX45_13415 [Bryobacteraceae bacterium]|nr:hypothetical protein [Bryobacteraceae bacterium]
MSDPTNITALPVYANPLALAVPASVVGGVYSTFSVTYASRNGASDIASGQVQIDGCSFEWDSTGNLSLSGSATGILGTQGAKVTNGSCAIDLGNSSLMPVPNNPDAVRLSLSMAFKEQSMVGTHEVYATGTSAEQVTTAQTDLGALVVSQGQDFVFNVSPSSAIVPYGATVTLTFTVTPLNGFNSDYILLLSLSGGSSSPCFQVTLPGPLSSNHPVTGTITNNSCPNGGLYEQLQLAADAQSIGLGTASRAAHLFHLLRIGFLDRAGDADGQCPAGAEQHQLSGDGHLDRRLGRNGASERRRAPGQQHVGRGDVAVLALLGALEQRGHGQQHADAEQHGRDSRRLVPAGPYRRAAIGQLHENGQLFARHAGDDVCGELGDGERDCS